MSPADFGVWYLVALAAAVFLGAVLPVVPTGAVVSTGAVLAIHTEPVLGLVGVLVAGAGAAYLGDLVVYAACRGGGEQLARRVGWLRNASLDTLRDRLSDHETTVLLTSRLVPGGRVPVLLASGLAGYSWRRFAIVDLSASVLWAVAYMVIGLLGSALFDEPWEGVVAAIVLVLLVTAVSNLIRSRRRVSEPDPAPDSRATP